MDQESLLDWIAKVHAHAAHPAENQERESFFSQIRTRLMQLGVGREQIEKRGFHINDPLARDFTTQEIYPVAISSAGNGFTAKSRFYDREIGQIFERFYSAGNDLPEHLVHVTCTGYVAPSPAQRIVSLRNAGQTTTVTHAYHMGCYGAFPAIRIASGYATAVDIVHTELCSLHMHPLLHNTEQLIIQSLFADGFIKYRFSQETPSGKHLKILGLLEETIPNSSHCMTWQCEERGLGMTLGKEVPVLIARTLEGYLQRLCDRAGVDPTTVIRESCFAIHPGGPKIVQQIRDLLGLNPHQIDHSACVLKGYGNMSSATLPHIWERMLSDAKVIDNTKIVSIAFGPGLVISGGLFEKGGN
jgi:predicted naringenin-chalcone synthase